MRDPMTDRTHAYAHTIRCNRVSPKPHSVPPYERHSRKNRVPPTNRPAQNHAMQRHARPVCPFYIVSRYVVRYAAVRICRRRRNLCKLRYSSEEKISSYKVLSASVRGYANVVKGLPTYSVTTNLGRRKNKNSVYISISTEKRNCVEVQGQVTSGMCVNTR